MIKRFFLLLIIFSLMTTSFSLAADTEPQKIKLYGEILEVKDTVVEINLGTSQGINNDSTGKVYIVEKKEDGSQKIIYLADLDITEALEFTSTATVKNVKGKIEKGNPVVLVGIKPEATTSAPEVIKIELSAPLEPVPIGIDMEAEILETLRLTEKSGNNIDPVWVPQGDRVYFVSNRNNDYWNIYTMNVDGSNVIKLTRDVRRNFSPDISSDGTKLVFVSSRDGHEDLYIMNHDGSQVMRLTEKFNLSNAGPTWSPDGKKVAFVSFTGSPMTPDADIYIINSDGSCLERITMTGDNFAPHWSPDGKKLLFVSARTGYEEIYILDLETKDVSQITELKSQIGSPRWSPDGSKVAFMINKHNRSSHICIISADGSHYQELTEGDLAYNYVPYWAPDGQSLVYISSESHVQDIYIMKFKWVKKTE